MKRPALYCLLYLAAGIILAKNANGIYCVTASIILCIFAYMLYRYCRLRGVLLLPLAALLGFVLCFYTLNIYEGPADKLVDTQVKISGEVRSIPYRASDGKECFILNARAIKTNDGKSIALDGDGVRVYADVRVYPGDMVAVSGELSDIKAADNPGEFDYRLYMLSMKCRYMLYSDKVKIVGRSASLSSFLQHIKENTCEIYYATMPEREASLMCGMMLGETSAIEDDISELYKKTGIYHVLAISGLHITLLAGVLMKALSRFGSRIGMLGAAVIITCYCILTGCSVAVVRAVLMFYILLAARLLLRDYDIVSSAAVTACVLLIHSPFYIFDAGFQFSFAAVIAIGLVGDIVGKYRDYAKVIDAVGVSVAADIVTKPVSMYNFYYINPWSIAANILLVPFMTLAVGAGFIIAVVGFVSKSAASLIAMPVTWLLDAVEGWCNLFVTLPYSQIITGKISVLALLLLALIFTLCYRLVMSGKIKYALMAFAVFVLVITVSSVYNDKSPLRISTAFLNVGQGDCTVVIGKDYCFAVDGGKENSGNNVLLPYIMSKGVDKIDCVFVSHTDSDHIGGITEIIGKIDIGTIYTPLPFEGDEEYELLRKAANKYGVRLVSLKQGQTVGLGKDRMYCLYAGNNATDDNNRSMVNKYVTAGYSVLFTGDIEKEAEQALCEDNADISADILKVAHHGSKTSSTSKFLDKVKPRAAVISAKYSVYGHPDKTVTKRFENKGIPYFLTENGGAVIIKYDDSIKVERGTV